MYRLLMLSIQQIIMNKTMIVQNSCLQLFGFIKLMAITAVLSPSIYSQTNPDCIFPMFSSPQQARLIPDVQDIYGIGFRDLNQDRRPDLYLVSFRGVNRLLINQGPGFPFKDVTVESGLGGNLMPMDSLNLELGTVLTDFDNDGDGDVMLAGWGETIQLFRNDGHLRFTSIDQQLPLFPPVDANAVVTADVNCDGWLDLFITDEHFPNYLLIHTGKNQFIESSKRWGIDEPGISQGAAFCDVDLDGDPDLYVCNWSGPDRFYRNDRFRGFTLMLLPLPTLYLPVSSNAPCFGDFDNDGDFDFIVTNREGRNFVYRNESSIGGDSWVFQDVSEISGMDDFDNSYGCVMADFNHDRWLDVFITNIGPNRFYLNQGDGTFSMNYSDDMRLPSQRAYSTGTAVADVDDDGDMDLFVANKDTFSLLFLNPKNDSSFLKIRLQGVGSNRDAVGAKAWIYKAGYLGDSKALMGFHEVQGGGGYLSMNALTLHFGTDTVHQVDVQVEFPCGKTVIQKNVFVGQSIMIYEQKTMLRWWFETRQRIFRLTLRQKFWIELLFSALFFWMFVIILWIGRKRYKWHSGTISIVGTGFMGFAMAVMIVLNFYPLTTKLAIINGMIFLFWVVLLLYGERLLQLRQDREKYRNVLIDLGNRVTTIHEDKALMMLVTDRLVQTTEYNRSCMLLYNESKNQFYQYHCRGCGMTLNDIQSAFRRKDIQQIRKKQIVFRQEWPDIRLFKVCQADMILSIQRVQFFGVLTLGAGRPIKTAGSEEKALFSALSNQLAVAFENNAYVRQSNEMIKKLTEAEVREAYLHELETVNENLDKKNQALQHLYDELKQTETQLIHSEKMASLGQLVAGISHELNNPVGFIYANLKQLKTSLRKIESNLDENQEEAATLLHDMESLIGDALKGSQMVKTLVEHLRRFSHIDQAERKRSNIHEGLETCLMILRPKLSDRINVHRHFLSSGLLECNIGQVNQVFLNVLSNAAQAIAESGDIWIDTCDINQRCEIRIRDNGQGIGKDSLPRIFEPFYTTKDVGEGTGLGLSISYAIVKQHGGDIQIESKFGQGTEVIITMPA